MSPALLTLTADSQAPPEEGAATTPHATAAADSSRQVVIIEMWAGIGTLSAAFDQNGHPPSAFCEIDQFLTNVFLARHSNVLFAGAFEDLAWKD